MEWILKVGREYRYRISSIKRQCHEINWIRIRINILPFAYNVSVNLLRGYYLLKTSVLREYYLLITSVLREYYLLYCTYNVSVKGILFTYNVSVKGILLSLNRKNGKITYILYIQPILLFKSTVSLDRVYIQL